MVNGKVNNMNKTLYRIEEGKMICGVCNGLSEYLNMDVTIVRALYAILSCCFPPLVIAYFVLAIAAPVKEKKDSDNKVKEAKVVEEKSDKKNKNAD